VPVVVTALRQFNNHLMNDNAIEKESLKDEMRNVIEEARMVIPGIQALFGFQTVAVFNNRFQELPDSGVSAHIAALALLAFSLVLLMTPAAYHRLAERGQVSRRMINLASRLITFGMVPLMCAIALDVYVVLLAALDSESVSLVSGVVTLAVFVVLWFVFPLAVRGRKR
jgi:hypothetical protein